MACGRQRRRRRQGACGSEEQHGSRVAAARQTRPAKALEAGDEAAEAWASGHGDGERMQRRVGGAGSGLRRGMMARQRPGDGTGRDGGEEADGAPAWLSSPARAERGSKGRKEAC